MLPFPPTSGVRLSLSAEMENTHLTGEKISWLSGVTLAPFKSVLAHGLCGKFLLSLSPPKELCAAYSTKMYYRCVKWLHIQSCVPCLLKTVGACVLRTGTKTHHTHSVSTRQIFPFHSTSTTQLLSASTHANPVLHCLHNTNSMIIFSRH